jgi:cytochrome P450
MLEQWILRKSEKKDNPVDDTRTAALHVLLEVAFDLSHPFSGGVRQLEPGFTMTYVEAVRTVLDNIPLTSLFISVLKLRKSWWQPRKLQQILAAAEELRSHMSNLLDHERELIQSCSQSHRRNLANSLLGASEKEMHPGLVSVQNLTKEEVMGNLFIFNFAGHDTTANTVAFSLALLAAYPELQQWLLTEVATVAKDAKDFAYECCFPRLKRCRAFMVSTFLAKFLDRYKELQMNSFADPRLTSALHFSTKPYVYMDQ